MTHDHDPLTEALRDNLHRHAADAPNGDYLAERIIAAAENGPVAEPRTSRGWRTWTLPLIAAGAVAAVVGAVVALVNFQTEASHTPPGTQLPTLSQSNLPTTPLTTPPTTTSVTTTPAPTGLTDVRITDLTFVGDDDGWALGSADCIRGTGRCTALLRTTDGHTWTGMPGADFNVPGDHGGCADPCVRNIRFANDEVGYAFGPDALFLTRDGGASWERQDGGAIALETLDDNVIRVTGTDGGCPGPCNVRIETSAVGSTDWTPTDFQPDSTFIGSVLLARGNGGYGYLLVTRNPAGGAEDETSTLYRSADLGATWDSVGEPCPQTGSEIDSSAIAGGADGRVSVLCEPRLSSRNYFVATSADGGVHFSRQPGEIPVSSSLLTGDPATVLVAAGVEGLARSVDGGATWQRVDGVSGEIGWVGFESQTVGRAVSADGTTIWTTHDGGATWRPATVG